MNKAYTAEELNKEIAYTKQIIATTTSWKCKRDRQKYLSKLYKVRNSNG